MLSRFRPAGKCVLQAWIDRLAYSKAHWFAHVLKFVLHMPLFRPAGKRVLQAWIDRLTNNEVTLGQRKDPIDDQLALNLILERPVSQVCAVLCSYLYVCDVLSLCIRLAVQREDPIGDQLALKLLLERPISYFVLTSLLICRCVVFYGTCSVLPCSARTTSTTTWRGNCSWSSKQRGFVLISLYLSNLPAVLAG